MAGELPKRRSLSLLAVCALSLIVFSYLFSLGIAIACVELPLLMVIDGFGSMPILIILAMGVTIAITIVSSLIPRRDKFVNPGVKIEMGKHPALSAVIEGVTRVLEERLPDHLYISLEANASVSERGGRLGFGSRRVMVLGLPLMAITTVSEFRAVIAHECAHFYAGDTWLGPRVYSTRAAMVRMLKSLTSNSAAIGFMRRFVWARLAHHAVTAGLNAYWKLFLRGTQLISRQQEYRSDELAAHIAGSEMMMEGLRKVHLAQAMAGSFWPAVVNPTLAAGFRASLADSFREFASVPAIKEASENVLSRLITDPKTSPYDSHPPLQLRLQRLAEIQGCGAIQNDERPATAMLEGLDGIERDLLDVAAPNLKGAHLEKLDWDTGGPLAYIALWRKLVDPHAELLIGYKIANLPGLLKQTSSLAARLPDPAGMLLTREQRVSRAAELIWMALALQMVTCGWKVHARPGMVHLYSDEKIVSPQGLVNQIIGGGMSSTEWISWCENSGLSSANLYGEAAAQADA